MRVATIGSDPVLALRRSVAASTCGVELIDSEPNRSLEATLEQADVLFIGVPRAERFAVASQAARSGTPVFVEWPPTTSIRECAALVRMAEESGLECGVSRPLRFDPLLRSVREEWRANLVSLSLSGDGAGTALPGVHVPRLSRLMADAVDLACALVKSSSVQRVDAEATRDGALQPDATLFSLRFHSGAYAQVFIRLNGPSIRPAVYASGGGVRLDGTIGPPEEAMRRETEEFLNAVRSGYSVPVSALDGLHTLRIVERIQAMLR